MAEVVGETCESHPQVFLASPSEDDAASFAGSAGDRADTGPGGELILGRKAFAHVAKLGQDLCGIDASGGGTT
jgi:hypothetical protein